MKHLFFSFPAFQVFVVFLMWCVCVIALTLFMPLPSSLFNGTCAAGSLISLFMICRMLILMRHDNSDDNSEEKEPGIHFFELPVSYENKTEAEFHVLKVLAQDMAFAREVSYSRNQNHFFEYVILVFDKEPYPGQIVTVKNPKRVGTYTYATMTGFSTYPVIDPGK